jgi:hypothetical protein
MTKCLSEPQLDGSVPVSRFEERSLPALKEKKKKKKTRLIVAENNVKMKEVFYSSDITEIRPHSEGRVPSKMLSLAKLDDRFMKN